jgi:hypothetical protein
MKPGILGFTPPITVASGALDIRTNPSHLTTASGRTCCTTAISLEPPLRKKASWGFTFRYPRFRSLWSASPNRYDVVSVEDDKDNNVAEEAGNDDVQTQNWVLKILHVKSLWRDENGDQGRALDECHDREMEQETECGESTNGDVECEDCEIEEDRMDFDRDSFSKLLRRVSLAESRLYAQMSYLGNLAYCVPQIKSGNRLRYYGLKFVTSSLEKKELASKSEKEDSSSSSSPSPSSIAVEENPKETSENDKDTKRLISASAAYHIAASAASYLHSRTKNIIPFQSSKEEEESDMNNKPQLNASFLATTDSVTAVVAAKEEVKQAVADDLNSTLSSPCEWYICDDDNSLTRFFVIQGSESLASWQANLLFEPIEFEGMDVIVHRGIYEAAKGIYEQMLPEVKSHLQRHGNDSKFRFTGHSLGGSLSLLVNLMLFIRGEVPPSSLLPVITFGAPAVMCGGDRLLRELGLPKTHVHSITMHRDIVPRAFSCNYPNHVAEFLKAINGNFRNHPCLNNQRVLYAPMGEFLILQPDEKVSPNHHLLPSGSGLYALSCPDLDSAEAEKQIQSALSVFLNSPHPLEILSERSAYGSEGTIHRDHDMNSYLRSVRNVIRHELNRVRKNKRERRRKVWWPLVTPRGINGVVIGKTGVSGQLNLVTGVLKTGRESLKRFSRLIASQHMHLIVFFFFPAKMFVFGAYNLISFR